METNEVRVAGPERERIYRKLLDELVQRAIAPGARLVESQIALRLGVSRTPVREALLHLERDGFVAGEPHRGFRVTAPDEHAARETFPIVGALQGLALVESGSIAATLVAPLERSNEELRAAKTPVEAITADSQFHRILISLCPNERLIALIETLHRQLLRYEHIYMSDASLIETSAAQHSDIIDGIRKGDFADAERAVRANYASGLAIVISKLRYA